VASFGLTALLVPARERPLTGLAKLSGVGMSASRSIAEVAFRGCQVGFIACLSSPQLDEEGNSNHRNSNEHPILDSNAKDVDPLNKHVHYLHPPLARKIGIAKLNVYYFYI
jgi:hypothetical protein